MNRIISNAANWSWPVSGLLIGLFLILVVFIFLTLSYIIMVHRLDRCLNETGYRKKFKKRYSPDKLSRYSLFIEWYIKKNGSEILEIIDIGPIWLARFEKKASLTSFRRSLYYCSQSGAYAAFLQAFKRASFKKAFINWLNIQGAELALLRLADGCDGRRFDGQSALELFGESKQRLRELVGHPEWRFRYFGLGCLLHDTENAATQRLIWNCFDDTHWRNREIIALSAQLPEREKFYRNLNDFLLHDPQYAVRKAARERIAAEFDDLYSPKIETFNQEESLHLIELLQVDSSEDRDTAFKYLSSDNYELRLPAARFLENCRLLRRLLAKTTLDDREELERNFEKLSKAAEVNVTSFLGEVKNLNDGGGLLLAARILFTLGHQSHITDLAAKVFAWFSDKPLTKANQEIYTATLKAIKQRGDHQAVVKYVGEARKRVSDPIFMRELLACLPLEDQGLTAPLLLDYLTRVDFCLRRELLEKVRKLPAYLLLPPIFAILKAPRDQYPSLIRRDCLWVLCRLELPYCLQFILENLPRLSPSDVDEFAGLIKVFPSELLREKAGLLLSKTDSTVRAGLMEILAALGNRDFMKVTQEAMFDADPEVRLAAVRSLYVLKHLNLHNNELSLLRDPVRKVRIGASRVLADYGSDKVIAALQEVLEDDNEVEPVKLSIIEGLGQCVNLKAIDVLTKKLFADPELAPPIIRALGGKKEVDSIERLVEVFADSSIEDRQKTLPAFKLLGSKAEPALLKLLQDPLRPLKSHLQEILTETGFMDEKIRQLTHRQRAERQSAAEFLFYLDTYQACRGLIMAAKDPDPSVRVFVVKALERLSEPAGQPVLAQLQKDPTPRVRKFTHWAQERLLVKNSRERQAD